MCMRFRRQFVTSDVALTYAIEVTVPNTHSGGNAIDTFHDAIDAISRRNRRICDAIDAFHYAIDAFRRRNRRISTTQSTHFTT